MSQSPQSRIGRQYGLPFERRPGHRGSHECVVGVWGVSTGRRGGLPAAVVAEGPPAIPRPCDLSRHLLRHLYGRRLARRGRQRCGLRRLRLTLAPLRLTLLRIPLRRLPLLKPPARWRNEGNSPQFSLDSPQITGFSQRITVDSQQKAWFSPQMKALQEVMKPESQPLAGVSPQKRDESPQSSGRIRSHGSPSSVDSTRSR